MVSEAGTSLRDALGQKMAVLRQAVPGPERVLAVDKALHQATFLDPDGNVLQLFQMA